MKFIYCMDKNIEDDLKNMGLKIIGSVNMNGEDILVFANDKEVVLNVYQKKAIMLSNRMSFDNLKIKTDEEK